MFAGDQQAVLPLGGHQGLEMLSGELQPLFGARGGGFGAPGEGRIDLAHDPGGSHGGPPHHHPIGTGEGKAAQGVGAGVDVAIGDHRDGEGRFHLGNRRPIGLALEALLPGAAMQGEQLGSSVLQLGGKAHGIGAAAAPSQPRFGRDRDPHGRGDRRHDPHRQLGIADQATAAAFFGDLFHRAAHVDVDQKGALGLGPPGRFRHGRRPHIKQLHPHGPRLLAELFHLLAPVAQLQPRGIHHFGEQQGLGGPAAHQAAKNPIAHPRQRGLEHPAAQLAGRAIAGQLEWT